MQDVYYCCKSQLLQRNFSFSYFEYLINSQQNYCERLPLYSVQLPLRLTGEFEFWNFGFWGKSKHFRFHGRVVLPGGGGDISWRERGEVISFSVHFPLLKCKIFKIQACSALIFNIHFFRFKMDAVLHVDIDFNTES